MEYGVSSHSTVNNGDTSGDRSKTAQQTLPTISWLSSTDRSHGFHLQTDLMAFIYRPISWLSSTDRSHGFHLQTDLMAFIYGFQTDLMAFIYRPISWLSSTDRSHAHSSSLGVPQCSPNVQKTQGKNSKRWLGFCYLLGERDLRIKTFLS